MRRGYFGGFRFLAGCVTASGTACTELPAHEACSFGFIQNNAEVDLRRRGRFAELVTSEHPAVLTPNDVVTVKSQAGDDLMLCWCFDVRTRSVLVAAIDSARDLTGRDTPPNLGAS